MNDFNHEEQLRVKALEFAVGWRRATRNETKSTMEMAEEFLAFLRKGQTERTVK